MTVSDDDHDGDNDNERRDLQNEDRIRTHTRKLQQNSIPNSINGKQTQHAHKNELEIESILSVDAFCN